MGEKDFLIKFSTREMKRNIHNVELAARKKISGKELNSIVSEVIIIIKTISTFCVVVDITGSYITCCLGNMAKLSLLFLLDFSVILTYCV